MREQVGFSWRHFDFWLLGAVLLLIIFGVAMIRSAVAGNIELTGQTNLVNRQLIFAIAGLVMMVIVASIDYHYWSSVNQLMYISTAVALALLNVVAKAAFGSARWFNLFLINVQPSEIAKLVIILVLADYFTRNQDKMGNLRTIARSFMVTFFIVIWVLLQPNLSTSIVILVLWFTLLWVAGLRIKHLIGFVGGGLVGIIATMPFLIQFNIIQDYQLRRITTFLFPDPNARHGDTYNIQQALISIGSGGLFGQGYGHGTQVQLRFLKVRWSDFIFSATSQEFGFIGAALVILVLVLVFFRCIRASRLARDNYGALICYGVAVLLAFQAIVNVGVNLKMMPATGLTFPFVSYGGSSLITNMIGIGLVQSVILRHKALEF